MSAFEELDVGGAGLGGVAAGEVEHLGGHVEPVDVAGRADPLGRQQHVDAAAGAEVEHGLAGVEVGDGGRVAAAEAGQRGGVGQVAEVVVVGGAPLGSSGPQHAAAPVVGDVGGCGVVVVDLDVDALRGGAHRVLLAVAVACR